MNIVSLIKDQLSGDVMSKLGSSIGESEDKTRTAAGAAVPALLSALAGMASSGGVDKLIDSLRQFDAESLNRLKTDMTQGDAGKVHDRGADVLGSLLGGNLPAIIDVLARFSGVGAVALKSLLSYLAPLILSVIAAQMKGKSLTPASLGGFFDEQKANIQGALPAGLSLASIPSAPRVEAPGMPAWMMPLAGLILVGLGAWYFLGNEPAAPEAGETPPVAEKAAPVPTPAEPKTPEPLPVKPDLKVAIPTADEVTKSLDDIYTIATQALTSVKDAETAEAAAPKLTALDARIETVKAIWGKLPEAAREAVRKATAENLNGFKSLVEKTLELPGVGDKLKAILEALIAKLSAFAAD